MAPTDDQPRKPSPRKRTPAAKKPAPRAARSRRTPRSPIRDAASTAAFPPEVETGNGHSDWVDYEAETTSWDPWEEGGGSAEERGLNRTLGEWLEAVVPPEAQIHFFNAGREFAAGVQATVEHHLNRGGEDDDGGAQALRIEIE